MKKRHRVREQRDFLALLRKGRKKESRFFTLFIRPNRYGYGRFAFVVSKHVAHKAIVRNQLRRRAREWVRTRTHLPRESYDMMMLFKKGASEAPKKNL